MDIGIIIIGFFGFGCILLAIISFFLWKPFLNLLVDTLINRLLKDPYEENIFEMYNVFRKVGVQNVIEADIRGETGEPLQRPFGTPNHDSKWEQLLLNPVYFSRKPIVEAREIQTKVVIGPEAKKPLTIDTPVMIAAMSGLSSQAILALVKGTDTVKSAINIGMGPFFPDERKYANKLIIQYHYQKGIQEEEWLYQADAIEILLGYGALASAPLSLKFQDLETNVINYGTQGKAVQNSKKVIKDGFIKRDFGLSEVVSHLKQLTGGIPIGVKIGATHHLEQELEFITKANIDFVSIDGKEAGIYYAPGILADDVGLPTLPALSRTRAFLDDQKLQSKISLIISGGLFTPGQFLKALVLGADAVYVGTIALVALAHNQMGKILPWEPLSQLVYEKGVVKDQLSMEQGARSVGNFLKSCHEEIILAMRSLGKTSFDQLTISDLCAITPEIAGITGVQLAFKKPRP